MAVALKRPSQNSNQSDEADVEFDAHSLFKVKLERQGNPRLGLAYRAEPHGLVITAIVQGSPVDDWNHVADSDRRICTGDVIIGVDHEDIKQGAKTLADSNGEALVKALKVESDSVTLKLRKVGPRWHIEGETADCIEKINYVTDQGMVLELVQPDSLANLNDDTIRESDLKKLSRNQFLLIVIMCALPNLLMIAMWSDMGIGFDLFGAFAPLMMNNVGNLFIFIGVSIMVGMYLVDWHRWESRVQRGATAVIVVYIGCLGGILKCRFYPAAPMVITLFHLPILIGILRATALKQVSRNSFYRGIASACFVNAVAIFLLWMLWMNVDAWAGNNQYNEATKLKLVKKAEPMYKETFLTINGVKRPLDYHWDCKDKMPNDFVLEFGEPVGIDYELTVAEKKSRTEKCGSINAVWFLLWMAPFIVVIINVIIAAFCTINGTMIDLNDTSRAEKALKQFVLMVGMLLLGMWVAASVAGASMRLTSTLMAFCGAGLVALFVWMYFEVGAKLINSTLRQSKIMNTLVTVVSNDWFRACVIIGFNMLIPAWFLLEMCRQKVRRLRKSTTSTARLTAEAQSALHFLSHWQWASIFVKVNWLAILYWTLSVGVAKITVLFLSWLNERLMNVDFFLVNVIFFWIGYIMFLLPPVPGIPVYITSGIIIAAQARNIDGVGFVGGIVIAVALSFVLKICAVCGQYSIGFFMGKSVKVQQLVGVDKVLIRAVEKILLRRGLEIGKVAVLVGGPDWPTSVLCGILRLNLFQCCLGTVPVLLVSSPCVLAGAFLAGPEDNMPESSKSMWDALSSTALVASGMGQLASGIIAMYYIREVVDKHGEDLAKYRPEHEAVRLLTMAEQLYVRCYEETLNWSTLPRFWLAIITIAAGMNLVSNWIFVLMDEACFRPFQVKDKISDPNGLDCGRDFGCALVRIINEDTPLGYGALLLFFMACILHFIFLKYAGRQAKKKLKCCESDLLEGEQHQHGAPAAAAPAAQDNDGFAEGFAEDDPEQPPAQA